MADSGGRTVSRRPWRRGTLRRASRLRSLGAGVAGLALASTALAACGSSGGGTGPVTINYYVFDDVSGSFATAVTNCSKAERRQVHHQLQQTAETPPTTSGCSWCGGWPRPTTRWTSSAWT